MMAVWTWFISTRVGRWIVGIALTIAGLAAALAVAFVKGKHAQAEKDAANDAQERIDAAEQTIKAANVRKDVENDVDALPQAGNQTVADADPGTAAGDLRTDGWVRDDQDKGGD